MSVVTNALLRLSRREDLTFEKAYGVMDCIISGKCPQTLISAYLTAFTVKGETVDKIAVSAIKMKTHGLRLSGYHSGALEIVRLETIGLAPSTHPLPPLLLWWCAGSQWPSTATGQPAAGTVQLTSWRR